MPTPDEADALTLNLGSPVLDLRRTTRDRAGRAVAHVHIVVSADRVSLAYRQFL
jgi:DNA-binding GntR family transcriptional regulator